MGQERRLDSLLTVRRRLFVPPPRRLLLAGKGMTGIDGSSLHDAQAEDVRDLVNLRATVLTANLYNRAKTALARAFAPSFAMAVA